MVILTDAEHTVDATAKTITLASPYDALSLAQIFKIYNLTTGSVIYDVDRTDGTISISGAVVTYAYDDASMANSDSMLVEVDVGTTPGGTSVSDAISTNATILNPDRASTLSERLFNAQALDAAATGIGVSQHTDLAFVAELAGLTGIVKAYDSIDGTTKGAELEFMLSGSKVTEINTTTTTAKYHCLFANCAPHYIIFDLSSRTAGSVTLYMLGKGV